MSDLSPLLPPETWQKVRSFVATHPSAQVILNCFAGRIASIDYHSRETVPETHGTKHGDCSGA